MKAPKISLKKIEQEFDLAEFYPDVDFSGERTLKEALGQAIIDKIQERTEAGDGIRGALKSPYSKLYSQSLEFKAAGKKRGKVNMTLTGDMLASVDLEMGEDGKFKIVIPEDQVPKAFNHLTGDTVPKRNWFGVTKKELKEILGDFSSDLEFAKKAPGLNDIVSSDRLMAIDVLNSDAGGDE